MLKQVEDEISKEDVVRRQLTLRAIVWDAGSADETAVLDRELEAFQIIKIMALDRKEAVEDQIWYEELLSRLEQAGVREEEALLVTDQAGLAGYINSLGKAAKTAKAEENSRSGMAVVFYERGDSAPDVLADMIVQGFAEIGIQFLDRVHKRKNRLPWNILYTKRTCVREITLSDLDELYTIYCGEGITDYTEPLFERQKEETYTKSYIECMYYYYGYGMWAVCDRENGKLIGRAGIEHREADGQVLMELGYIIRKEYQKKGYAAEVCQAILEYAAKELEMEELHCFIHPRNRASIRTAQKLGFRLCTDRLWDGMLHFIRKL